MKKYIGYRKQGIECDKKGNRIEVPCIRCSQINLICIKYKTYCHSKVCLSERTGLTKKELKKWQKKTDNRN